MKTNVILSVLAISMISAGAFAQTAVEEGAAAVQKAGAAAGAASQVGAGAANAAGIFGGASSALQRTSTKLTGGTQVATSLSQTVCRDLGAFKNLPGSAQSILDEGLANGIAKTDECMTTTFGDQTLPIALAALGGFEDATHHKALKALSAAEIKEGQEGEAKAIQAAFAKEGTEITLADAEGRVTDLCNVEGGKKQCVTSTGACSGLVNSANQ